jgi:hypothetical protein
MPFSATISLSLAGADTGPFNLFSNADTYGVAFASAVPKASLLAVGGYLSTTVPDFTTICRVKSTGTCTNYVDIPIDDPFIYVYRKCGTTQYYYNPGVIALKVQDDNSPTPNCYEKINEGLLSAMDVLYALTINLTLVSSSCECV